MSDDAPLTFKVATEPEEFEQIYELNYATFVEEIPQHEPNESRRLVDPLLEHSTPFICLKGDRVVGMVAVSGQRPFSLDRKLPDLDRYLPPGARLCEGRLLAVRPEYRSGRVFVGLMRRVIQHCDEVGYDLAVFSATARQEKLYLRMGCKPFGPQLGTPEAPFRGMYLTREMAPEPVRQAFGIGSTPAAGQAKTGAERPGSAPAVDEPAVVSVLPGPVHIADPVRAAFEQPPLSHRSERFIEMLGSTRAALCGLVHARSAALLVGSGTLANDVVAAQLSLLHEPGVILVTGEFGQRLTDHARRWGLDFQEVRAPWGAALPCDDLRRALGAGRRVGWLWAVHCETSTGVIHDLDALCSMAAEHDVRVCLDAVSSIGVLPVDLSRVHLASGVSGKGLAAYPGLAIVFYNHDVQPSPVLPRYLDLGLYAQAEGVPFTGSSNLLRALACSLETFSTPDRAASAFQATARLGAWLRAALEERGVPIMAAPDVASPAVFTIAVPPSLGSLQLGDHLAANGFVVSYRSAYLVERNLIQVCLMGDLTRDQLRPLVDLVSDYLA